MSKYDKERYHSDEEYRERLKAHNRKWREANKEKYRVIQQVSKSKKRKQNNVSVEVSA